MKWTLFLAAVVLLVFALPIEAKSSRARKTWKLRQADCEKSCPEGYDDPNCVLRCVSPRCFETIYGAEPLEAGEIDFERKNTFRTCVHQEDRQKFSPLSAPGLGNVEQNMDSGEPNTDNDDQDK